MLRREFLLGAAAGVVAVTPLAALAAEGPPLTSKAEFVAWMTANRPAEEAKYLSGGGTAIRCCSASTISGLPLTSAPS
jgi:hypothetical protein